MLRKIRELLKRGLGTELLNLLLGILIVVALIAYTATGSVASLYLLIFLGGAVNLSEGLKLCKKKGKQTLGMSMVMLGIIVIVLDLVLLTAGRV